MEENLEQKFFKYSCKENRFFIRVHDNEPLSMRRVHSKTIITRKKMFYIEDNYFQEEKRTEHFFNRQNDIFFSGLIVTRETRS